MLKIDVIKFETQDVVTTSIPTPGVDPAPLSCNCGNDGCSYNGTDYVKGNNCSCPVTNWDDHTNARSYPYA